MNRTGMYLSLLTAALGASWSSRFANADPGTPLPQGQSAGTAVQGDLSTSQREKIAAFVQMTTASAAQTEVFLNLDADRWAAEMYATGEGVIPLFASGDQLVKAVESAVQSTKLTARQQAALWIGALAIDAHSTKITNLARLEMLQHAINASWADARLCRRLSEFAWNYSLIYVHIDAANAIAQRVKAHDNLDVRAIGLMLEARILGAQVETEKATVQLKAAYAMAQDEQVKAKVAARLFDHVYAPTHKHARTVEECASVAKELSLPDEIGVDDDGSLELARVLNSARVFGKIDLELAPRSLGWIINTLPASDSRRGAFCHLRALLPGQSQADLMADFSSACWYGPPRARIQCIEIFVRHLIRSDFVEYRRECTRYNDGYIAAYRDRPIDSTERRIVTLYLLQRAETQRQLGQMQQAKATAKEACELAQGDSSLNIVADIYLSLLADK